MKYIAREQIIKLFTNPQETMYNGLWYSGYEGEGEYRGWFKDGKLQIQCFFKNKLRNGDFKQWHNDGRLEYHFLYKNNEPIRNYLK